MFLPQMLSELLQYKLLKISVLIHNKYVHAFVEGICVCSAIINYFFSPITFFTLGQWAENRFVLVDAFRFTFSLCFADIRTIFHSHALIVDNH